MSTGRIAAIRADKGFGFIKETSSQSNGNDLFFHRSAVVDGNFDDLQEGQEVSYRTEPDPRDASRFRAVDVRVASTSE